MIEKIVSGGQTGVDQAVLNTAVEFGIAVGGWCPKGGLDENNVNVLDIYLLTEATTDIPAERTKLNVRDSDGTLIIVPSWPLPENIKDGTNLTIEEAARLKKPHLIVNLETKRTSVDEILDWCSEKDINILNVGGPRESSCPGIYEKSCELFSELFHELKSKASISMR